MDIKIEMNVVYSEEEVKGLPKNLIQQLVAENSLRTVIKILREKYDLSLDYLIQSFEGAVADLEKISHKKMNWDFEYISNKYRRR